MTEAKKVVFATQEVTVHTKMSSTANEDGSWNTESQIFLPGHFVDQDMVPPYLLEAIKAGTAPGLEIMTENKASELKEKAEQIRAIANNVVNVQGPASEGDQMAEAVKTAKSSS